MNAKPANLTGPLRFQLAIRESKLGKTDKLILYTVASYADYRTGMLFASQSTIARGASLSRGAVNKHLAVLQRLGVVEIFGSNGRRFITLHVDRLERMGFGAPIAPDDSCDPAADLVGPSSGLTGFRDDIERVGGAHKQTKGQDQEQTSNTAARRIVADPFDDVGWKVSSWESLPSDWADAKKCAFLDHLGEESEKPGIRDTKAFRAAMLRDTQKLRSFWTNVDRLVQDATRERLALNRRHPEFVGLTDLELERLRVEAVRQPHRCGSDDGKAAREYERRRRVTAWRASELPAASRLRMAMVGILEEERDQTCESASEEVA